MQKMRRKIYLHVFGEGKQVCELGFFVNVLLPIKPTKYSSIESHSEIFIFKLVLLFCPSKTQKGFRNIRLSLYWDMLIRVNYSFGDDGEKSLKLFVASG